MACDLKNGIRCAAIASTLLLSGAAAAHAGADDARAGSWRAVLREATLTDAQRDALEAAFAREDGGHPAGGHGIGGNVDTTSLFCENAPLIGEQTGVNLDLFEDSHLITRSWAELDHPDGVIELPSPGGTFDVTEIAGNAVCRDLGDGHFTYPCIIGAPGTEFTNTIEWPADSGEFYELTLPGATSTGAISFAVAGYTFGEDDPNTILLTHRINTVDLCETNDPACAGGTLEGSWSQVLNLSVLHPRIAIDKSANVETVCEGEATPVTYTYTVTNPGNTALSAILATIADDGCGSPTFLGGDTDGDNQLDPDETWILECSAIVDTTTTSTVSVTGLSSLPLCDAIAEDSLTITAENCQRACCFTDGSCVVLSAADCTSQGGTFQEDDMTCATVDCPRTGACCLEGACLPDLSQESCTAMGGLYQGPGTICAPDLCPPVKGACCFEDGSCAVRTRDDCEIAGGTYTEDGTICTSGLCDQPAGACCFEDGSCVGLPQMDCVEGAGYWQGAGTLCATTSCPQPAGACCFDTGACFTLTFDDCNAQGGTYRGDGVRCTAELCPQPMGACCLPDESCAVLTEGDCEVAMGVFAGDDTNCTPGLCDRPTGACCFDNGSCTNDLTQADCTGGGGLWQGDGSTCTEGQCPPTKGACCFDDGVCVVTTASLCGMIGGAYEGDETICAPGVCTPAEGACCFDSGACATRTQAACIDDGGQYQGNGTTCIEGLCPPITGACCYDDGTCAVVTQADCADAGGVYQGDDSICAPELCTLVGACCVGNDCIDDLTPLACVVGGGGFQGNGTTCAVIECGRGACCFDDGGCVEGVALGACAGAGGAYLGDDSRCTPALPGDPGIYRLFNHPTADEAPPGYGLRLDELFDVTTGLDRFTFDFDGPGSAMFLEVGATSLRIHGTAFGGLDDGDDYDPAWMGFVEVDITYGAFDFAPGDDDLVVSAPGGTNTGTITWLNTGESVDLLDRDPGSGFVFRFGDEDDDNGYRDYDGLSGWGGLEFVDGAQGGDREWVFIAFDICADPPMGACCFDDGSCMMLSERGCNEQRGAYQGAAVSCGEAQCDLGACCIPEDDCLIDSGGDCIFGSVAQCEALAGTFQGPATTCELENCIEPTGACCFEVGCDTLTEFCCGQNGGLYLGDDTTCASDECFVCDGLIVEMTMIWDGDQPVGIRAYDGFIGAPLLADIDNVMPGDRVSVGPLAGAIDSFWEVFEAGTENLIGLSKFDRSCTDEAMNGIEDCGDLQGNGKTNGGNFINDWRLDGLVNENGRVLACSGPSCPEDLDANGVVGFGDILAILGAWNTSGPEDIDGDGTVGFGDVLLVLARWGTCGSS